MEKTRLVLFVFTHISFTQSIPTSIPAISIKIHFLYKNKSPTIFKWNFFLFAIKFLAQQNLILKSKSIWLLNNSIHMNHLLDRKKGKFHSLISLVVKEESFIWLFDVWWCSSWMPNQKRNLGHFQFISC